MPDISMCNGGECPLKETCYRYKAKPSEYQQAYIVTPPYEGDECEYFMTIYPKSAENKANNFRKA
jgi:hypothetical protein